MVVMTFDGYSSLPETILASGASHKSALLENKPMQQWAHNLSDSGREREACRAKCPGAE